MWLGRPVGWNAPFVAGVPAATCRKSLSLRSMAISTAFAVFWRSRTEVRPFGWLKNVKPMSGIRSSSASQAWKTYPRWRSVRCQ
jgi:hypothetical protein